MQNRFSVSVAALAFASLAATALAHNHITVDSVAGSPQRQIVVRVGYYPTETSYTLQSGRVYYNAAPALYDVSQVLPSGPVAGWYAGDEILLTSDFYAATGRLDGGDFRWEITSVANVDTGQPGQMVWGDFGDATGELIPSAASDGATRDARSFAVGFGSHDHDQGYAFSAAGTYDVTLVAWDANGLYADSAPVTIRFQVGNFCDADVNQDGVADQGDIDYLINVIAGGDNPNDIDADFNHDGAIDQGDVDVLTNVIAGGECP